MDGEYRWHHVRAEPLRDRDGRIIEWYGLSVDIDEGKKIEERLRRSEAYLAEAQRLTHTATAAYDATKILYFSDKAFRLFGFDPLQGLPSREAVWQRIHSDDVDTVNEKIERALRERRSFQNEFELKLPDGTVKHVDAEGRLVALGRAHDLLLQARWTSTDLVKIVRSATEAFDNPDAPKFSIAARSPDDLGRRDRRRDDAQRALHQHHEVRSPVGAEGRVDIAWTLDPQTQRVHLTWTEKNGPAVHAPEKRSFGTRLIETLGKELKGDVKLILAGRFRLRDRRAVGFPDLSKRHRAPLRPDTRLLG